MKRIPRKLKKARKNGKKGGWIDYQLWVASERMMQGALINVGFIKEASPGFTETPFEVLMESKFLDVYGKK